MTPNFDFSQIQELVALAIREDIGSGDVTTECVASADVQGRGTILAKQQGVIAGLPVAQCVFTQLSDQTSFTSKVADGSKVDNGDVVATVQGAVRDILPGERLALNFLQRLSGIATLTARYVEKVRAYPAKIMDTRKTTPGLRYLEKYAVKVGGGTNHRQGLYDQVLIKDNHIEIAAGGSFCSQSDSEPSPIQKAVRAVRNSAPKGMIVEVETESLQQVKDALAAEVDIIMIDNMSLEDVQVAAKLVLDARRASGRDVPKTEASGGVTFESIEDIAKTGVDTISIGALTHSARALDISLEIELIT